mmetsp:Transcript_1029/g.113  ORF Transcript_1029/g.113 Transcript_1029/m.113 type:complete len:117 (-) Transcript_1029:7-357(-)
MSINKLGIVKNKVYIGKIVNLYKLINKLLKISHYLLLGFQLLKNSQLILKLKIKEIAITHFINHYYLNNNNYNNNPICNLHKDMVIIHIKIIIIMYKVILVLKHLEDRDDNKFIKI